MQLPDFLQNVKVNEIHRRRLSRMPDEWDKSEGSILWDITRPVAEMEAEILQFYLPQAIRLVFPQYATGEFLDLHAQARGLARKEPTKARGVVVVHGTNGTEIPPGTFFDAPATPISDAYRFVSTERVLIQGGQAEVPVEAVEAGAQSNVPNGAIIRMDPKLPGTETVENPDPMTGGTDQEIDDYLRERIREYDTTQGTSYIGNERDYIRWAMAVQGVGFVDVDAPEDGSGEVTLVISDSEGNPATQEILDAVRDFIMSPADRSKRLAPTGAKLKVLPSVKLAVNITAKVEAVDNFSLATIAAEFRARVARYLPQAARERVVRHTAVAALLSETPGVQDFSNLKINGVSANVQLAATASPAMGTVTLT